jgi:hypothetical protein
MAHGRQVKFDPPTSADSKLRTKTGARFKRTFHQKQSLESVPPRQKNHEGLRELDLECDQKSPVSLVSSSIKGESLTNSAEKLRREFHLLHLGLHFAQKGRLTSHDYILDHVFPTNFTITKCSRRNMIQKNIQEKHPRNKRSRKNIFLQQQQIIINTNFTIHQFASLNSRKRRALKRLEGQKHRSAMQEMTRVKTGMSFQC